MSLFRVLVSDASIDVVMTFLSAADGERKKRVETGNAAREERWKKEDGALVTPSFVGETRTPNDHAHALLK